MADSERTSGDRESSGAEKWGEVSKVPFRGTGEQAERDAKYWAEELKRAETGFAVQVKRAEDRKQAHVPEKEFLVWEKDARDSWERIKNAEREGQMGQAERAQVEAESIAYGNPDKCDLTIEAQSGNFYGKRIEELLEAIKEKGGSNEDAEKAKSFPSAVMKHLYFKFTPRDELRDEYDTGNPTSTWLAVDKARNIAHNNSIRAINSLNDLADKYGTTRFTFRNFRTKGYEEKLSPDEDSIAENDRACVEGYYSCAFKSEVARLEAKRARAERFGLY